MHIFLCFLQFPNGQKRSECSELMRKSTIIFFLLDSNSGHPVDEFPYFFGRLWDFLVITDDWTTVNMDPCKDMH